MIGRQKKLKDQELVLKYSMKSIETISDLPVHIQSIIQNKINEQIKNRELEAIVITGSYARGDFTEYSDLDIWFFPEKLTDEIKYQLKYVDNILVSTNISRIEDWEDVIKVRAEYLREVKPVDTIMEVSRFINPEWLVEIEVDAIVNE